MRVVAQKPHDGVVKFDTYRNLQRHRHRAVLTAITARHLVYLYIKFVQNQNPRKV